MSTKTISKRVALATVVALGAGVLSLVSVSSASATANNAPGAAGPTAVAGTLNIATTANTSGLVYVDATSTATVGANSKSVGLLTTSDVAGNRVAGTTQTATLLSTGSLVVYGATVAAVSGTANSTVVVTVTGGTIVPGTATSHISTNGTIADNGANVAPIYNASNTAVAFSAATTASAFGVVIKPNAGATSMIVNQYGFSDTAASTDVGTPASGTLTGSIAVSIASTSVAGTVSLTTSSINYNTPGTIASATAGTTAAKVSSGAYSAASDVGVGTSAYTVAQYAVVVPKDAYGSLLGSGHLVQASATNGAVVALTANITTQDAAPASAGTLSTAFTTTYGAGTGLGGVGMAVGAGTLAATGGSTIVTVSVDGIVIGTKSFTFTGKVAKVMIAALGNGVTNGSTNAANQVSIKFYDAAGNAIVWDSATTAGNAAYPAAITKDPNAFKALGSTLGTIVWPTATTSGYFYWYSAQAVQDSLVVNYSNSDGSVVASNSTSVSTSGTAYTYTAALDKASYAPGEIATLKVTFKDSTGSLANDSATGISGGTTATTPSISGGSLTAITAPTSTDASSFGVATYKFIVGSTTGSFQLVASFPTVNANTVASAQTVSYKVVDGSTSLNDVLKGIVSLIASINKQIAALAKLVTKKK